MNVSTWMTRDPVTIGPREMLSEAQEKMHRGGFRRLPVVDDKGKLIGIIAESDLRAHAGYLPSTHVDAAMTETPITIGPDQPIETAAEVILQKKIGGLPVLGDDGRVIGMITTSDLLQGLFRSVSGGEERTGRIDFQFTAANQSFALAVEAVERAGGKILGLGTLRQTEPASGPRTFYLRVQAGNIESVADSLRRDGYAVHAVHRPAAA
jgi:acetoin utilization protein AcuB